MFTFPIDIDMSAFMPINKKVVVPVVAEDLNTVIEVDNKVESFYYFEHISGISLAISNAVGPQIFWLAVQQLHFEKQNKINPKRSGLLNVA